MKIEQVNLFYVSMPEIEDIADGSQDALLVRVRADGISGWGECEASPLVCIANWICPMSHAICKPVCESVLGRTVDTPNDIINLGHQVRYNGLDIAQTDHTFSGIEMALWDLLGKKRGQPVYELLGYETAYPKTPYASQLFGDTPEQTFTKAQASREQGYRAVKFGWGPFGKTTAKADRDQLVAAREGLGREGRMLVDAGTVWLDHVDGAKQRLADLNEQHVLWLEEPFIGEALNAYAQLAAVSGAVKLAGGEGAHNFHMARQLIDYGKIGYVQIDTGRIGGIGPAKAVADYAHAKGVIYVNHTFTTHLALSASLQPCAGIKEAEICEYPVEPKAIAVEINHNELAINQDGQVQLPAAPGLGVEINLDAIKRYLVPVEIHVAGKMLYTTPNVEP